MKSEESRKAFQSGFNCAQSVFIPFAGERGLADEAAARIAASFGAGMGRMQETCGAVTGGLMALGLEFGFERPDDPEGKDVALRRTKDFLAIFKAEFGTLGCRELLGCDLNTAEGQKMHAEQKQRELICMRCVQFAASSLEAMRAD
jgi:C_GCAxxG_C_C family probable redox protein